jgi:rhamnosyl/mannosyltransferase
MRVLHVFKTSSRASFGGGETFIDRLCRHTGRLGAQNTVFALNPSEASQAIQTPDYRLIQMRQNFSLASTGFSIDGMAELSRQIDVHDLVHYHTPNPYAEVLAVVGKSQTPALATHHADAVRYRFLSGPYSLLQRAFYKRMDRVVATSAAYAETSQILRRLSHKVTTIPIGISDTDLATPTVTERQAWAKRFPKPFALFVGALRAYKGLPTLLSAVRGKGIPLVIAGTGELAPFVKREVSLPGYEQVTYLGAVSEETKAVLLSLCHCFVMPSINRAEAFGIGLLEAAIFSKPLVSSRLGTGTSLVNKNGVTGLEVSPDSDAELRAALLKLLGEPETVSAMGAAARDRAGTLFTAKQQASAYMDVYTALAAARS